jgi:hypothetical protein
MRELRSKNGSYVSVERESNRDDSDYLQWSVGPGYLLGVAENTAETRKWLRDVLRHMESEANRVAQRRGGKQS